MKRLAVVLFAGVVMTLGLAAPASADDARCPTAAFCLFQNVNFGGAKIILTATGHAYCDLGDFNFNNKASSMINNTSREIILAQFVGCNGGLTYNALPHSVDSTFVNNNFDDRASVVIIP
jgi:peptidase inhibitor family I36